MFGVPGSHQRLSWGCPLRPGPRSAGCQVEGIRSAESKWAIPGSMQCGLVAGRYRLVDVVPELFVLGRGDVADLSVKAALVVPVDPVDDLGLEPRTLPGPLVATSALRTELPRDVRSFLAVLRRFGSSSVAEG